MQRGEMAFGRYLRVRVLINISKPLKRGSKITAICGENILAIFKYERLPDFCYICSQLDHQKLECDEVMKIRKIGGKVKRKYGPWMRTASSDFLTTKKENQATKLVERDHNFKRIVTRRDVSCKETTRRFGGKWSKNTDHGGGQTERVACEKQVYNKGWGWKGKAIMLDSGESGDDSGNEQNSPHQSTN